MLYPEDYAHISLTAAEQIGQSEENTSYEIRTPMHAVINQNSIAPNEPEALFDTLETLIRAHA